MIGNKEAFDRYVSPDIAVDPLLKKALKYLQGEIEALEETKQRLFDRVTDLELEVSECRSKISSGSEKSSAKTPDGPETVSRKPAQQTASRSKRRTGGTTAGPGTS